MSARAPIRAALLTPAGRGAIATLRVGGPGAPELVAKLFLSAAGRTLAVGQRIYYGRWGHEAGEEIIVTVRQANAVEIHCHGGHAAADAILQSLRQFGCAVADWKEELSPETSIAHEARLALTRVTTERAALHLLDQFNGALSGALRSIRGSVEGDSEFAIQEIGKLLATAAVGLHLACPWSVVIAGRPNVGKSSLINALLGYERAIVFDQPGTTRDVVSAQTAFDGWPVELSDTAGLRASVDAIEVAGVELARRRLLQADLIVLLFDLSKDWSGEDDRTLSQWPDSLIVHNKADLDGRTKGRPSGLQVSAVSGAGLVHLQQEISRRLVPSPPQPGDAIVFTQRQVGLLKRALASLQARLNADALAALSDLDCSGNLRASGDQSAS